MTEQTDCKTPKIRFKSHSETWKTASVSSLLTERNVQAPKSEQYPLMAFIAGQGVAPKGKRYNREFLVSDEFSKKYKRTELGDFIYSSNNLETGSIGTNNYGSASISPVYSIFSPTLEGDSGFIGHLLCKKAFINEMVKWRQGVVYGQWRIHESDFLKIKATFPTVDEQTQIGEYFRELDRLIELHQRKHDKLVTLKKAMLQKMFPQPGATTPEIRFKAFSGEWLEKKLGDCVLIQRGGSPRPIENFITQDANGINWVKIGDVKVGSRYITQTEEKIKPEGVSKSREVFKGDLILSNSMSFGRPYLMAIDGCIHDGWLLIRNDKNLFDLDYLLQLLSSETMTEQYRSLAAGGVVNNLNSALVQSTNISFPDKPEQQKIGTYFRLLDELITKHATQLQKLQQIKSACLEKMFV